MVFKLRGLRRLREVKRVEAAAGILTRTLSKSLQQPQPS